MPFPLPFLSLPPTCFLPSPFQQQQGGVVRAGRRRRHARDGPAPEQGGAGAGGGGGRLCGGPGCAGGQAPHPAGKPPLECSGWGPARREGGTRLVSLHSAHPPPPAQPFTLRTLPLPSHVTTAWKEPASTRLPYLHPFLRPASCLHPSLRPASLPSPQAWRSVTFWDNVFQLVGVPVITVQLRYDGWVTEMQVRCVGAGACVCVCVWYSARVFAWQRRFWVEAGLGLAQRGRAPCLRAGCFEVGPRSSSAGAGRGGCLGWGAGSAQGSSASSCISAPVRQTRAQRRRALPGPPCAPCLHLPFFTGTYTHAPACACRTPPASRTWPAAPAASTTCCTGGAVRCWWWYHMQRRTAGPRQGAPLTRRSAALEGPAWPRPAAPRLPRPCPPTCDLPPSSFYVPCLCCSPPSLKLTTLVAVCLAYAASFFFQPARSAPSPSPPTPPPSLPRPAAPTPTSAALPTWPSPRPWTTTARARAA